MEENLKKRKIKLFRDLGIIVASIIVAFFIHQSNLLANFLNSLFGVYFVIGAFITGIFFASTFTVAIATSVFLTFAQHHNPLAIALVGGLGAFIGDSFILKFLRDDLIADFEYLEKHFPKRIAKRIIHSRLIFWFAPIFAAILIASPLPDEIGLLLLAGIRLKYHHFFFLSFILNAIGILVVSLFGKII